MGDVIDRVIEREGGFVDDPADGGGRTDKGISERAHPEAWADGKVTYEEARAIYEAKYLKGPGFDRITVPYLREQLVDFGVHSGPAVAIQKLQEILKVKVDGVLGPKTLQACSLVNAMTVNNQLVASRVKLLGRIVSKHPAQLKFLNGWLSRALEFLA
jgi:lysozyme family protein